MSWTVLLREKSQRQHTSSQHFCVVSMSMIDSLLCSALYLDSYKLLETNSGYHFFNNDSLDDLEQLLRDSSASADTAILGIFTDFPGNPHLRSADLPRLRALADKHHVPVIIDETVGCHLNVSVLPYADVVVASLTKVFSGLGNVLGGA